MSFVRVTKTVKDKGVLIRPSEVLGFIDDRTVDWYCSPFTYGEDAVEYFEEHSKSIKGYTGSVTTQSLYWDLDCKGNFEKVRENGIKLVEFLTECGLDEGIEIFFSGNKGIHVFLHTNNSFTPEQTSKICYNIAVKLGIPVSGKDKVFDSTVYNINRIFRVPYTKHQESGLYKVHLSIEELFDLSEAEIHKIATDAQPEEYIPPRVDASSLLEEFGKIQEISVVESPEVTQDNIVQLYGSFNPLDCPPDKRRCLYILENGYFGPGERENATIRLAAYYRGLGKTREETRQLIIDALHKREQVYGPQNKWNESDITRNLDQVYSPSWNGGTYSCKSDDFLRSKCDLGTGPCCDEKHSEEHLNVVSIGGLINQYLEYGKEALLEYPKTGIKWIDDNIRIRPRNFSILNGANGSGKTSLLIIFLEHLNMQKIWSVFFSLDMANTSLFEKLGARYTEYSQKQIEEAFSVHTFNPVIVEAVKKVLVEKFPYTIFDFTSSVDSTHIERTIRILKTRQLNPLNIQIAFIDYAGRVHGDKDNEFSNATQVALEANDVAKRTSTHIMFLSQIPREDGDHTRPIRSSRVSKHSGAWEENATFILNCWRPFGNGLKGLDYYMHIYIAKNRSGSLGEQVFNWDGKTGSISDMTIKDFDEYVNLCHETEGMEIPEPQFESAFTRNTPEKAKTHINRFNSLAKKNRAEKSEDPIEDYVSEQEREHGIADVREAEENEGNTEVQHSKVAKSGRFGSRRSEKN